MKNNILHMRPNIARCIELCLMGNFNFFLYIDYSENEHPDEKELQAFKTALPCVKWVDTLEEAHIINALPYVNPIQALNPKYKSETLETILKHVEDHEYTHYKEKSFIDQESTKSLLKVGCERLKLTEHDIEIIDQLSQIIASEGKAKVIGAQHVAEAIQYRYKPNLVVHTALKTLNEMQTLLSAFFTSEKGKALLKANKEKSQFEIYSEYVRGL
jgi:hypothetical protein